MEHFQRLGALYNLIKEKHAVNLSANQWYVKKH